MSVACILFLLDGAGTEYAVEKPGETNLSCDSTDR